MCKLKEYLGEKIIIYNSNLSLFLAFREFLSSILFFCTYFYLLSYSYMVGDIW